MKISRPEQTEPTEHAVVPTRSGGLQCVDAFNRGDRDAFARGLASNALEVDAENGFALIGGRTIADTMWTLRDLFPSIRLLAGGSELGASDGIQCAFIHDDADQYGGELRCSDQTRWLLLNGKVQLIEHFVPPDYC